MFESFYNLREQPFGMNPDPRFLYLSKTHHEAFSSLLYRTQIDSGFLALVAQPGMGKTTLLFHLLHQLKPTARTAFIFNTQCSSHDLLRYMLSEFGCDTGITDPVRIAHELKSVMAAEAKAGRRCVLLIDEAQNLQPEVLETVRLLSDFETPRRKLLQIILSGQAELADKLAQPGLQQFRQRLSCVTHIQRFTPEETALYIAHRLVIAGCPDGLSGLFSVGALTRIAELSDGIPRVINSLCFNALSLGFALDKKKISLPMVEEAARDLGFATAPRAARREWEEPRAQSKVCEPANPFAAIVSVLAREATLKKTDRAPEVELHAIHEQSGTEEVRSADAGQTPEESRVCTDPAVPTPIAGDAFHSKIRPEVSGVGSLPQFIHSGGIQGRLPRPAIRARSHHGPLFMGICACALIVGVAATAALLNMRKIPDPKGAGTGIDVLQSAGRYQSTSAGSAGTSANAIPTRPDAETASIPALHRNRPDSLKTGVPVRQFPEKTTLADGHEPKLSSGLSVTAEDSEQELPLLALNSVPEVAQTITAPEIQPNTSGVPSTPEITNDAAYVPPQGLSRPVPGYPDAARTANLEGNVFLLLSISSSGTVDKVKVLRGNPMLVAAAESAVKNWKYSPAQSNGTAVASQTTVELSYSLQKP